VPQRTVGFNSGRCRCTKQHSLEMLQPMQTVISASAATTVSGTGMSIPSSLARGVDIPVQSDCNESAEAYWYWHMLVWRTFCTLPNGHRSQFCVLTVACSLRDMSNAGIGQTKVAQIIPRPNCKKAFADVICSQQCIATFLAVNFLIVSCSGQLHTAFRIVLNFPKFLYQSINQSINQSVYSEMVAKWLNS